MVALRLARMTASILAFALIGLLAQPAVEATTFSLGASLDGAQEVPPNASPGTGDATMTYDDVTNLLSWDILFQDLLAGTTAAHFHGPAAPGVNAGVQVPIPLGGDFGQTAGELIGSAVISDLQEGQLLAGLWYINIHTQVFPGGEIRGQVGVPEPGTLALLALGSAAMLLAWRRRS